MIKIENTQVVGWEPAIRGMRNPKNSWDRSDSKFDLFCDFMTCEDCPHYGKGDGEVDCVDLLKVGDCNIGPNDHKLMMSLAKGGPVHAKYRRMITVYVDITAPLYWWKEFDTYKVGTVANSCSTMHTIPDKEFTLDDFSHDHLMSNDSYKIWTDNSTIYRFSSMNILDLQIKCLNAARQSFLDEKDPEIKKLHWWQMIQLLPSSYNQKRTIMLNYEVLAGIYPMRRNHKLDEWREFCDWIESLPYSEIIIPEMYSDEELEE